MGEAIFSKYPKSKGVEISNSIKSEFGLGVNATLEDILRSLSYKSESQGTVVATVQWPDGNPVQNTNIQMTSVIGENYIYKTNTEGKVLFRTTAGKMFLNDLEGYNYYDVTGTNTPVDCPVGTVKQVIINRPKTLQNGGNYKITNTGWINFSPCAKNGEVSLTGGWGQNAESSLHMSLDIGEGNPNNSYANVIKWANNSGEGWAIDHIYGPVEQNFTYRSAVGLFQDKPGNAPNITQLGIVEFKKNYMITIGAGIYNPENWSHVRALTDSWFVWVGYHDRYYGTHNGLAGGTTTAFSNSAYGGSGGTLSHNKNHLFVALPYALTYNNTRRNDYLKIQSRLKHQYTIKAYLSTNPLNVRNMGYNYGLNLWYIDSSRTDARGIVDVITEGCTSNNGYVWINNFQYK